MITLNEPKVIATSQIIGEPIIHITGSSADNSRKAEVWCPVTDENGGSLAPMKAEFTGEDFNTFYTNFINDKSVVDMLFVKNGIELDISELSNDFVNTIT